MPQLQQRHSDAHTLLFCPKTRHAALHCPMGDLRLPWWRQFILKLGSDLGFEDAALLVPVVQAILQHCMSEAPRLLLKDAPCWIHRMTGDLRR